MTLKSTPTGGGRVAADITALLKARNTLLWIVSGEESRVESALLDAAGAATYETRRGRRRLELALVMRTRITYWTDRMILESVRDGTGLTAQAREYAINVLLPAGFVEHERDMGTDRGWPEFSSRKSRQSVAAVLHSQN
jgi:hypothetical protein